jgi:uncharacterized membrane protein
VIKYISGNLAFCARRHVRFTLLCDEAARVKYIVGKFNLKSKKIVRCAVIAAIYAVISLVLAPISYGPVQARVSEALTLLPIFTPDAIIGVTLGCFITNLIGVFTGANILGVLDIFLGTVATFAAALCTRALRNVVVKKLPVASVLPPILFNALVVGAELWWVIGPHTLSAFLIEALWVGVGEALSCVVLGFILVRAIESTPVLKKWFEE